MTFSERAGRWLLAFSGVLSAILLLGVAFTLWQGIGTHTWVGAGALVLAVLVVATADLAHGFPLLLLGVAAILLLVEAFVVPGFGVPGILGVLCFAAGMFFLTSGVRPGGGTWEPEVAERFGLQLIVTLLVAGATVVALARLFPSAPYARRLLLAGDGLPAGAAAPAPATASAEAVAITPLRPAGRAQMAGEVVDVVTEGDFLEAGTPLRVLRVEGNRVVVRRRAEGTPA
jgi:membrane-bound serine protease (ClpP class)